MSESPAELLRMARRLARRYRVRGMGRAEVLSEAYLAMAQAPPWCARLHVWRYGWLRVRGLKRAAAARCARLRCEPEAPGEAELDDLAGLVGRVLPRAEAAVVRLLFWQGLTFAEAAASLGVSVARVGQLRARALERLRLHLKEGGDGELA